MAISPEQIQALADAVSAWRMQENLMIAFYVFYGYYVLTTFDEEVAVILPQKWSRGKILYAFIRYGFIAAISVQFARDFRNYYVISPMGCKAMLQIYYIFRDLIVVASNTALGLCLGALLRLSKRYLGPLLLLCVGPSVVSLVFNIVTVAQYPITPLSSLDEALGYPCYYLSDDQAGETTIINAGKTLREYLQLAITLLLVLLGVVALATHYKGRSGLLIQVIRRDGGIYYVTLLVFRLVSALLATPAVTSVEEIKDNTGALLFGMMNISIPPILAQRLLINMRNVDYMGSEPIASRLLFAPPAPQTEDSFSEYAESFPVERASLHAKVQSPKFGGMPGDRAANSVA